MKKRILIIDDEEDILTLVKERLEVEGYEVSTLSDPLQAEHYVERFQPDLIILDVLMPHRSGFNIIEDFEEKGLYKNIPKIFLTCISNDVEKMVALASGVSKYVTKPFEVDHLLGEINSVINE